MAPKEDNCILSVMMHLYHLYILVVLVGRAYGVEDWTVEVEKCLKNVHYTPQLHFPLKNTRNNDLKSHVVQLSKELRTFQTLERTKQQNFDDPTFGGPSLEEFWIQEFCCDKPLDAFGGYVPLFIQWVTTKMRGRHRELVRVLTTHLSKDILYVTVSNHAFGIKDTGFPIENYPNILVMSAGGNGHIPLPHLKRNIPYQGFDPALRFKYDMSFVGTPRPSGGRKKFLDSIQSERKAVQGGEEVSLRITEKPFLESLTIYNNTLLNLCPRGVGRTSFRLYEVIHVGKLPVYMYSDIPWIPYEGTSADMREFDWVFQNDEAKKVVETARELKAKPAEVTRRLLVLQKLRQSHYTYEGVAHQIRMYLNGGEKTSDLRCHGLPKKG